MIYTKYHLPLLYESIGDILEQFNANVLCPLPSALSLYHRITHLHKMLPWRTTLFHLAALILVANYSATPGLCAHDPGTISWKNPRITNNRHPIGDTVGIAWLSPSLGQQTCDHDLVLPNKTLNGWIPSEWFCSPSLKPSTQTFEKQMASERLERPRRTHTLSTIRPRTSYTTGPS